MAGEALTRLLYRGVMGAAAALVDSGSRLAFVPEGWRVHADRLGKLDAAQQAMAAAAPAIWLHAASVGELTAARPLLGELRRRLSGRQLVVSTMTRTGLALARALEEAQLTMLFPLDAPAVVRRLLDAVRLDAFLFTETEIWPTWLEELHRRGVPAIMVSGRVGDGTLARARVLRRLYGPVLREVTCCMQTTRDAERITALGADPRRVQVTGSLKFDVEALGVNADVARLGRWLERAGRRLVVAGSTHAGEEEIVLEAYGRLASLHPDVAVLLAPRHPERFEDVARTIASAGMAGVRYSEIVGDGDATSPPSGPLVVLLDAIGPLARCYRLGVVAFVGGSLVPVGGHNVLEPAQVGVPVLVGPHTENAAEAVERLMSVGGVTRVGSPEALALALDHLLGEPGVAAAMGERARRAGRAGEGAVERHLKIISARLSAASFARQPHA